MRAGAELREEKKATKAAVDEAEKLKSNASKYKKEVNKLNKSIKGKDKELAKSAESLNKATYDLTAARAQIKELQAELKRSQDQEEQAKAARDQVIKDKQALADNHIAELEKAVEQGYNEVVLSAIKEKATLNDTIYQANFDIGLEKAQISIGHELNKLKFIYPNVVFRVTLETTYRFQVVPTRGNAEECEGWGQ